MGMAERIKLFFLESRQELRRVNWPTREETIRLTVIVIIISLFIAFFLGAFDFLFLTALRWFLQFRQG
jgi:preprotein translocase subunit SecE